MNVLVRKPELLAPAGDWACLRAAVANLADAVYFGLRDFNARKRAPNFSTDELKDVASYLHDHDARAYLTLNTLVFSDELQSVADLVNLAATAGVDAIIVQDLGLAHLIHQLVPAMPIHASTQMTQTSAGGIEFLRGLGITRVILARELSLEQIAAIAGQTRLELEVFVHGALCVSYSGQCLASEVLFGRSANRGQCAQPCRLPYQLVWDGQMIDLGDRQYLLSPKDLAAYSLVKELTSLGVSGFKIEGRLKNAQYVAATVAIYRSAIDAAINLQPFQLDQQKRVWLNQSFSRGACSGFFGEAGGAGHKDLVDGQSPGGRGIRVGTVAAITGRGVLVQVDRNMAIAKAPVKPGDGIAFGEGGDAQGGRVFEVIPRGGGRFELTFGNDAIDMSLVGIDSTAWKTDDPAVKRELESTFARHDSGRRIPIDVQISLSANDCLKIVACDTQGNEASVVSQHLQKAQKHPLTLELAREQFDRLGNTPFVLGSIALIGPTGPVQALEVMAPKSVLNGLRRDLVAQLQEIRQQKSRKQVESPQALVDLRRDIQAALGSDKKVTQPTLNVLVTNLAQLKAVLQTSITSGMVYLDFPGPKMPAEGIAHASAAGVRFGLVTPRIIKAGEEKFLQQIADSGPRTILVRNLTAMTFFRSNYPDIDLVGDASLNVANEITAAVLARAGLSRIVPSADLTWEQAKVMLPRMDAATLEWVIYQHVTMFHTEHCLFAANLLDGDCKGGRSGPCRKPVMLRDRMGVDHTVKADSLCRNTVYHALPQCAAEFVPSMLDAGISQFRVDLTAEPQSNIPEILDACSGAIMGRISGKDAWLRLHKLMDGRMTRGTLVARSGRQGG